MPKMKTRSSAKKRFKKISKRLIKRAKAFRRHLLTKKTAKRKDQLRQACLCASIRCWPYCTYVT